VASNPILRQIFEKTILTVPGAVYYVSGALLAVSALAMLFVFLNRNRLIKDIEKVKSTIKLMKDIEKVKSTITG
jgi:hypothetical protein